MKKKIVLLVVLSSLIMYPNAWALKVGVTAGPHAVIFEEIKRELEKQKISVQIVEFNDFIQPNAALDGGDIDLNSYQHEPFLKEQIQTRKYKITSIAKTILLPMGVYSSKFKALGEIPEKGKIGIPNDPTNGTRALLLLEKAGLIELNKQKEFPTVLDILKNPKNLVIRELDAPQLPRVLADLDFIVVNTDWILASGKDPTTAIYRENQDSPYTNVIAVRSGDEHRTDIQAVIQVYRSQKIKDFIKTHFKGAVIPAL